MSVSVINSVHVLLHSQKSKKAKNLNQAAFISSRPFQALSKCYINGSS